jgi:hypothetical protein
MNWVKPKALLAQPGSVYGDARGNLYEFGLGTIVRISANGKVNLKWASTQDLRSLTGLAVSPAGAVYAFNQSTGAFEGPRTQVYTVLADRSLARVATSYLVGNGVRNPPSVQPTGMNSAVSPSGDVWNLGEGIAKMVSTGQFPSWWLTDSQSRVVYPLDTLAIASNKVAYGTVRNGSPWLPTNDDAKASTTIIRFALPSTK